ncbi:substrate-binding domain-containing protein [Hydrogenophaga sp. PAMC20947]|uniref:helix-turn-helix transcriptional regulator n=1 Tax=Hydrogenophaga sp. PAMC20947 TaxID=2565558 RepID=UPI00109DF65A|nr:substrate-binding domain-containing protein [Hydrogenophaga sp. PAMC20947]QCB46057.1 LysR family transcriptional regulator [Hydrogenophaga sp. PAMC20947]
MKRISIKPVWTIQGGDAGNLSPRLIELLTAVHTEGSLLAACQKLGMSYRHAWDLVRAGEAHFNTTLLHMERGKGSTLSPLAEKLVWADLRIMARLQPILDSLASELSHEIAKVGSLGDSAFRLHASYGFSIEKLIEQLLEQGQQVARRYASSTAAAAGLHDGACEACGIHIPFGSQQARALEHYAQWLSAPDLMLVDISTRRQGLMVAPGNPKKIYDLNDLTREDVRFINRPADSGTRFLLEGLLGERRISGAEIAGFEQSEATHASVAAFVASGLADAGFGLERPARYFQLDFIPMVNERYFLICHEATLQHPVMQKTLSILADPDFKSSVNALPGYDSTHSGQITPLKEAFAENAFTPAA